MFPIKDNIPTDRFPLVTVALIIANVVMYLVFQRGGLDLGGGGLDQAELVHYGAIPFELTHPGDHCDLTASGAVACGPDAAAQLPTWATTLTSMFTHGGLLHLGGNMLFLWIFGNNVEDSMSRVAYVVFYLLGGFAALGLQVLIDPGSTVPTLGASGAIAAVLGGYALLYPRARVLTVIFIIFFFTIIEIPGLLVLGLWFVTQVLLGVLDLTGPAGGAGGVAYFAHIGGFVTGVLLIRLFATRRNAAYVRGYR